MLGKGTFEFTGCKWGSVLKYCSKQEVDYRIAMSCLLLLCRGMQIMQIISLCVIFKLESFSMVLWNGLVTAFCFVFLSWPVLQLLALLDRNIGNVLCAFLSWWCFVPFFTKYSEV